MWFISRPIKVHLRGSAAPYFKRLTILKIDNIYKLKICCFIHRMRNETDRIPDIFLDVLAPASRIHNHNTRFVSNLNYFRPRVSTNLIRRPLNSPLQKSGRLYRLVSSVCHIISLRKNGSPVF